MTVDENYRLLWPYNADSEEEEEELEEEEIDDPCAYRNVKETVECYQKPCEQRVVLQGGKLFES